MPCNRCQNFSQFDLCAHGYCVACRAGLHCAGCLEDAGAATERRRARSRAYSIAMRCFSHTGDIAKVLAEYDGDLRQMIANEYKDIVADSTDAETFTYN
jgi:hypothetical protein